jgi:hypothetical protein
VKIIKAIFRAIRFDGAMENIGEQLGNIQTCAAGRFDVLIRPTTQNGAGL